MMNNLYGENKKNIKQEEVDYQDIWEKHIERMKDKSSLN